MAYIPESVKELFSTWFDPVMDGNCGFRVFASIVYGDQESYSQIRADLLDHVLTGWHFGFETVYGAYNQTREQVELRLASPHGSCGNDHWMWDADLFGFASMYNCVIVVYASTRRPVHLHTYGSTYLPISCDGPVERLDATIELVCTGNHWVQIQLAEDEGVRPLPDFSQVNRMVQGVERMTLWETLYRAERALFVRRGGHHPPL